jgi:VanZ family protein
LNSSSSSGVRNSGWLARWWPAVAWAAVIFFFSTAAFRSDETSRILVPILRWIFPHAARETLLAIHDFLRKCGHVTEYFMLSLLILRGIRAGRRETHLAWALAAIALVAGYAVLDELHQSFTPGRGGLELDDVLLDTASGAAAQAIAALLALWTYVRKRQREDRMETAGAQK